ncbi:type II secretion system protein [Massilia sp. Leaf139]|uniref:type II secretion system protein n=1 Tax=Massilia sp. Leaf139 TaxID=1736272 RepID=UPI0006FAD01C|nr:type II secretion system protein [Massilia sp. Leaf139]KQQ88888.1 type II secretion system pseudopilin PulG [Massilia sp. Leaf139]
MGRCPHRRQAGFTYVGMIVFVTIIGLVGAATLKVGALLQRAEAENELLAIGAEFSAALASYAAATPQGQPTQPASLEALLRDPRFPNPRRHLRRIFVDPITGRAEWGLVRAAEGGPIVGVHSLSQAQPLKVANFDARFVNFEHKRHLSEWRFVANSQALAGNGAAPGQGAPPGATMFPPPAAPAAPTAAPVGEQAALPEPEPPPEPPKPDEEEETKEEETKEEETKEETPPPEPASEATRSGF